jgi:hypothetical protein
MATASGAGHAPEFLLRSQMIAVHRQYLLEKRGCAFRFVFSKLG